MSWFQDSKTRLSSLEYTLPLMAGRQGTGAQPEESPAAGGDVRPAA